MKVNNAIEIDLENAFKRFEDHLNLQGNSRIFFSARYGMGKTYFLYRFFEKYQNDYESFHLFPVRYQISLNENILELLKYDIIIELFKKRENIFDECNENEKKLLFLEDEKTITTLLSLLPKIGRPLSEIYTFWNKCKENINPKEMVEKFIKSNSTETDLLSEIIKDAIRKIKGIKKSVLILDDLDRIDPEHIFRLLNAFSIHLNMDEPNKFGFDKVIIVADINNLKSIFAHKYGSEADFSGYIDKFYSINIYEFSNEDAIINKISQIIAKLQVNDDNAKQHLNQQNGILYYLLKTILIFALMLNNQKKANLREILKGLDKQIPTQTKLFSLQTLSINQNQSIIACNAGIDILSSIFGTKDELISVL
ncbi:MAG: P-loop NTPase fold protein, partial [Minisyncoccia bacterium]